MLLRMPLIAALAAIVVLAARAPVAGASSIPTAGCVSSGLDWQGRVGGNTNQACVGAGLSFVGPSSAISMVVGPTIITPAFVGTSIVAGGNVAIGP
jgi:hypothetical protein